MFARAASGDCQLEAIAVEILAGYESVFDGAAVARVEKYPEKVSCAFIGVYRDRLDVIFGEARIEHRAIGLGEKLEVDVAGIMFKEHTDCQVSRGGRDAIRVVITAEDEL